MFALKSDLSGGGPDRQIVVQSFDNVRKRLVLTGSEG